MTPIKVYYLSADPYQCASYHCNAHVSYCILRYTQLLAWAYYDDEGNPVITEASLNKLPKGFKFPKWHSRLSKCAWAKWVKESPKNFEYLWSVLYELVTTHYHALGDKKPHAFRQFINWMPTNQPKLFKTGELTKPPLEFGKYNDFLKPAQYIPTDSQTANLYRYYYAITKSNSAVWKPKRIEPDWFNKYKQYVQSNDYHF